MVGAVFRSQGPECHLGECGIQKILSMDRGIWTDSWIEVEGEDEHRNGCMHE